jgi:hypothetical protein
MAMFHMSNDSELFYTSPGTDRLPLYEAKLIHQFDHRWATYTDSGETVDVTAEQKQNINFIVQPRYWIDKDDIIEIFIGENDNTDHDHEEKKIPKWFMGWRGITSAITLRTLNTSIIPFSAVGNSISIASFEKNIDTLLYTALCANFNSLVLDFIVRQKVGGTNLNFFYIMQFPVLPSSVYSSADLAFIVPQVLELTYTAVDLAGFAEDIWNDSDAPMRQLLIKQRYGSDDPAYVPPSLEFLAKQAFSPSVLEPFIFNPDRRAVLRASLDARYAKLYGLTRDELRYILDPASVMGEDYPSETFRVLKDKEMAEYGEYRTGRLVLEAWDREDGLER